MWVAAGTAALGFGSALLGANSADKAASQQKNAMEVQGQLQGYNIDFQEQAYADQQALQQGAITQGRTAYEQSQELAAQQQQAAQDQYNDWEAMFGPIQENLSNYYSSMDPKDFARMGKGTIDEAYQTASDSLQKNLAQRGIQGGGVEAGAQAQLESATALARGQNVINAENTYNQAQQSFLQSGNQQSAAELNYLNSFNPNQTQLGSGMLTNAYGMTPSTAGVSNAFTNSAATAGNQANVYGNQAATGSAAVSSGIGSAMDWGMQAYNNYNGGSNAVPYTPEQRQDWLGS